MIVTWRARDDVSPLTEGGGCSIRSHEAPQFVSVQHGINEFMQQLGAPLAAVLAPELKALNGQPEPVRNRALDRAAGYFREALAVWLSGEKEINYCAQDNDILTAAGDRPEVDNQQKYMPVQHRIYARRCGDDCATPRLKTPEKPAVFPELSHASTGCMILHVFMHPFYPFPHR